MQTQTELLREISLGKLHEFELDPARRAVVIVLIGGHCISFVSMNLACSEEYYAAC